MPNPPVYRPGDHTYMEALHGAPRETASEKNTRWFLRIGITLLILMALGILAWFGSFIYHRISHVGAVYHQAIDQGSCLPPQDRAPGQLNV